MDTNDDILEYYRRELAYLRVQGSDFAYRYPKVAQRLVLTSGESADPHTERLIEAFAFLSARVHSDLDREFPQIAAALLDNLCPNLTQPVPSITVAQMTLDPSQGKVTAGMKVAKGSMLQAIASNGETCRFQVAWDTTLWPLRVGGVRLLDSRTLMLEICGEPGLDLSELEIDSLRFHLSGELLTTMAIHELFICALQSVELECGGSVHSLGASSFVACGFDEGQEVIPLPSHAHSAYGLLQEYFIFPRKFQFFELRGLRGRLGSGSSFFIKLVFDRSARVLSSVGVDTLRLGCVPVINLFSMTSEPIIVNQQRYEYLLVADKQRESSTEIHSVVSVIASDPDAQRPRHIASVFASGDESSSEGIFWAHRRVMSLRKDITGTDMYLSFVDQSNVRKMSSESVAFAKVLCTNRRLAEQVPPGARLAGIGLSGSMRIQTLYEVTPQRDPIMSGQALWKLVALLRLNHRSLVDGTTGVQTLRDILMLFAGDSARDQAQVRGVKALRARPATAQLGGGHSWRGHCRGTEVTLEFDPDAFAGNSPLVMASVLARFFALYTTVNSFVRVRVERGGDEWMQWPALTGRQCVI